jgi:ribonucleoside-diphosphate reductase alpha chain
VQGEQWTIVVGLLAGEPYEMFGGPTEDADIPKSAKTGFIQKSKVGKNTNKYDLAYNHYNSEVIVEDIGNVFENKSYSTTTRLLSLSLRHGAPVQHIVEQLGKDESEELFSLSSILRRALKKYIANGTIVSGVKKGCDKCGSSNLQYAEGCPVCLDCGFTKCK